MTYQEQCDHLTQNASIAVFVLMGAVDDVEFLPLRPRPADEGMLAELKQRWPGRNLRPIGVLAVVNGSPCCVLKEPLLSQQIAALGVAFGEYVRIMSAPNSDRGSAEWQARYYERLYDASQS
jgi:hypothetical protein